MSSIQTRVDWDRLGSEGVEEDGGRITTDLGVDEHGTAERRVGLHDKRASRGMLPVR